MSFFNPFMKGPDFGQGVGDMTSKIMQMLMMKKVFPGQQKSLGQTPLPPQGGMMQQPPMPPGQMPEQEGLPGGMTPEMLQKIIDMIGGRGGGF